jgi:hypothetical protein
MERGLLVRVGIDYSSGGWNAPCDEQRFCYVPMGKCKRQELTEHYDERYDLCGYRDAVCAFVPAAAPRKALWPRRLPPRGHFDPDFAHLTYGDCRRRAQRIWQVLRKGGFIAFYAGLRPIHQRDNSQGDLVYSIIGFYRFDGLLTGPDVRPSNWDRNEHTREGGCVDPGTVIVDALPRKSESGRLLHHIPIGIRRRGARARPAYRVTEELLDEWGGLDVQDGWLERSVFSPEFRKPNRFLRWFDRQNGVLIQRNNE